ncbi:endolytic transglycosylase MltG, partial [Candidatus Aerophobetes bacterium]|nr:endolytic transglycosylase MltG [Candidatus Aerophobetes bacterium]
LKEGKVKICKVTVPEGSSSWEIAELLSEKKITNKEEFLILVKSPDYFKKEFPWIEAKHSLEGYLFPDTYYFALEEEPARVIEKFLARFEEKVLPLCKEKDFSLQQILTMASIVEKETGKDFEKPIIAAVFYNRLKRGMKLMADPTVKYALKDFNRKLTKKDLAFFSLYNTYIFPGLPPGPICNPGIESIKAAISPAEVDYLYFVSRGDGTHKFSRTYTEHLKAIELYQNRTIPERINGG